MKNPNKSLRKQWTKYWEGSDAAWEAGNRNYPPIPPELLDLRCGATTRAGTPCQLKGLYRCGRCRLHGGLSTGPTSPEGKAKSALNGKKRSAQREPHEALIKPKVATFRDGDFTDTKPVQDSGPGPALPTVPLKEDGKVQSRVRCVDCAYISAGYTCMRGSGNGIDAGTPRVCPDFCETTAWNLDGYGGHR
jgi:hypothetical protein